MRAWLIGAWLSIAATAGAAPPEIPADAHVEIHRFSRGFVGVYALRGSGGVVVVDAHYARSDRWLLRKLARAGLVDQVTALVLTHGHADHAGGAAALSEALSIPVIAGAGDVPMLAAGDHGEPEPLGLLARLLAPTVPRRYPPVAVDQIVDAEVSLAPHGVAASVAPVGGHSAGSLIVRLDDSAVVLSGDLIRGGLTAQHRPKPHFFHEDLAAAHAALRSIVEAGAPVLLPAHGDALSAERLSRWLAKHAPE